MSLDNYLKRNHILVEKLDLNINVQTVQLPVLISLYNFSLQVYDFNTFETNSWGWPRFNVLKSFASLPIWKELKPFLYSNYLTIYPFEDWCDNLISDSTFLSRQIGIENAQNSLIFIKLELDESEMNWQLAIYLNTAEFHKIILEDHSYKKGYFLEFLKLFIIKKKEYSFLENLVSNVVKGTIIAENDVISHGNSELKLFNYQKETIDWMKSLESSPPQMEINYNHIIPTMFLEPLADNYIIYKNEIYPKCGFDFDQPKKTQIIKTRGGFLVDPMGSGKTITCLGLIASGSASASEFDNDKTQCTYKFKKGIRKGNICKKKDCKTHKNLPIEINFKSDDTESNQNKSVPNLVICPSHICEQWAREAVKLNLKIVVITTIVQFNVLTRSDIINSDIVIVSYNFLKNKNYIKSNSDLKLTTFSFKRIFFDEIHEVVDRSLLRNLIDLARVSQFNWLVTGTPFQNGMKNVYNYLNLTTNLEFVDRLSVENLEEMGIFWDEFPTEISKLFRRTEFKWGFVPITHFNYFLDFTKEERCIYDSYVLNGTKPDTFLLQLCCHVELLSFKTRSEIKKCNSLSEVKDIIIEFSESELSVIENKLKTQSQSDDIKKLESQVESHKRTIGYLKNIDFSDTLDCPICLEQMDLKSTVLTKCGHKFCIDCIIHLTNDNNTQFFKCPTCKTELNSGSHLYKVSTDTEEKQDCVDYWIKKTKSTKIGNVVHYIKTLGIETGKVILFSQWPEMLDKITKILTDCGIKILHCTGSVYQKNKSMRLFKTDPTYQVICLSSKDAASGANLTEATKIIFLEPTQKEIESQAISRSYRIGQTKPIEIIRFIIKDTIEEVLFT
jgi:SNF2 family DNA or RNA helicase